MTLGGGITTVGHWLGREWTPGDHGRRVVLAVFGVVFLLRLALTAFYLLQRRMGWPEAGGIMAAVVLYQAGFALLGARSPAALGAVDLFGIALFAAGSWANTASELARRQFKEDPANRGRLFTGHLFRYTRHPNYFGDILWESGWTVITRNPWAAILPVLCLAGFVFANIPILDRYLAGHYGDQYTAWAARTARLIPFIY